MSDILIKNMGIPKDYKYVDVRIFRDGTATTSSAEEPFYKKMDVVEVPTPHGRLIDADKLRAEFPHPNDWRNPELAYAHLSGIWATIDCAETIIEAEGT